MNRKFGIFFLFMTIALIATIPACTPKNSDPSATDFKGVPVPSGAKFVNRGTTMGLPKGSWGAVFAGNMSMQEAADWYERKLKADGLDFEKLPEKPEDEGYTIFNFKQKNGLRKVVIVNDPDKRSVNIQISGGFKGRSK